MRSDEYEYYQEPMGWPTFLAGALIGAGVALLLAPQTGSQLRGMLRNYASQVKDEALERGKAAWDSAAKGGNQSPDQG